MVSEDKISNILTIDVEELCHIYYATEKTKNYHQTPINIPPLLDLLDEHEVKSTFFIVGEIAEQHPHLIKLITSRGHEIGYHGYTHTPLRQLNPNSFENELERFTQLIKSKGSSCVGFRAPTFMLSNNQRWVFEALKKNGYRYDSSVFPAKTQLYGLPRAPSIPYHPDFDNPEKRDDGNNFWEFPLLVYDLLGFRIPAAGGFYLRLYPNLVSKALKQINQSGHPGVIYVHNWELDPNSPRISINPFRSFVTYKNINKTTRNLESLLTKFNFTSFECNAENMKAD